MEPDERNVRDAIGNLILPGDMVAVSVNNKQQIGIVSEVNWNTITFCGKEKHYPSLTIMVASTKWNKELKRSVGSLKKIKLNKTSTIVVVKEDSYIDKLTKSDIESDRDLARLFKKEIEK